MFPILVISSLIAVMFYGLLVIDRDETVDAATIGSISVTGGAVKTFEKVDYLLDGNILVSGTGSHLTFKNSTITLSQDVGIDGVIGGGDDHMYTIQVQGGGELEFINSKLTTQTGQLHPYYKIEVVATGSGSTIRFIDSHVEGPGEIDIESGASLVSEGSYFYELQDQRNIAYDIDDDGSTEDDVDYNNDGPKFTFSSGASGLVTDSELRDTFSFSTSQRDGLTAGNITVDGTNTNLTVINSFLDVDFESSTSTGSHNMLKVMNGGTAHLVGVAINTSASSPQHPAFYVPDSSSRVVYYRWLGAHVVDGMGIPTEGESLTVERIEGSANRRLTSLYLTSEILDYMGRTSLNWNEIGSDGWAFIPVITDLFDSSTMPNSDAYPDFKVSITLSGETVSRSTSFQSYPKLPGRGAVMDLFANAKDGNSVDPKAISLLQGTMDFKNYVVSPSLSGYFSDLDVDLIVSNKVILRGTSSVIDGKFYPSYYAFDGHLVVRSSGHLVINDTFVRFLTGEHPAYILIENGGKVEMNNVTISDSGDKDLYIYLLGTGTPQLTIEDGMLDIGHLVGRNNARIDIQGSNFTGSINLVGQSVDARVSMDMIHSSRVFARDCHLQLDGSPVASDDLDLSGVDLYSYDTVFDQPLDIDRFAMLTNVTFSGTLPSGRTSWLNPVGSGVIAKAWWVDAQVQDSVSNPLPGSKVHVQRVEGSISTDVSSHVTDGEGKVKFPLVQEEIRSTGRTYLGNYRLNASFRGYSSTPLSAVVMGKDVDAVISIPGGPNLVPKSLKVEGTLIDGFPVILVGDISNTGRFDAGPFHARIEINGDVVGEVEVPGIAGGSSAKVEFPWMTTEGEKEFELMVDPLAEVRETVENDNVLTQFNVIGMGPDYYVQIESPPQVWAYDTQGEFEIVITNIGEEDPEMNDFHVNVSWISPAGSGVIGSQINFSYIPPGSTSRTSIQWTPQSTGLVTVAAQVFSKYDRSPINSIDTMVFEVLTLPDIRVVMNSFQVNAPVPVTINTTVEIALTVENVGELPASDFMVKVYDGQKLPEFQVGDEFLVPGLEAEGEAELSFIWSTGLPVGYHKLMVVIDEIGSVREQNETNNMVEFQVMVDTPPDLTFTPKIGVSPKIVTEGKNVTFWATVKNIGRTKAMDALIHFSIDSDTNLIESREVDLSPGQETNISFGWTAEGLGLHTMFIVADYWDAIKEPIETNNLRSIDFQVISKPDLYMGQDDFRVETEGKINIGQEVGITAAIRNSGETDASNVFIRFYDGDPALGGKIISWKETQPSVNIDHVPAGGVVWTNVTWIPQTGGYHNIFLVLDLANSIIESDETNNKISWPVYVQTLPDLTFTNLSLFQGDFEVDSAGVGKTLIINATLENKGDTPSPAFKVNFFNGDFLNDPDPLPLGSDVNYLSGRLKGNSKMYIEMPWRVGYPKGERSIIVTVQVIDGNEQSLLNNRRATPIEIFDIDDVPELLLMNETLEVSTGYPGNTINMEMMPQAMLGMNLSVDLSLSNMGGKPATNASVVFLASNETDSWVEYRTTIMFIENNGTDFISGFWEPKDLGLNSLRIVVDPDNDIREFDEGNNILFYQIEVVEAPDLIVTLVRDGDHYNDETGQFDMVKGKEYELSFIVENTGNFTFDGISVRFTGPADLPTRSLDLAPYQTRMISFKVKPNMDPGQTAVWKCSVNKDQQYFEDDTGNNEVSSVVNILEPEEGGLGWIILLIVVIIVLGLIAVLGYYVYKKMQTKDLAKCSNCGGLVEIDALICEHCGIEFSEELECECGEVIPSGATECPACGRPVSGESVVEGEEGEAKEEGEKKKEEQEEEEIEELTEEPEPPETFEEMEEVSEEETIGEEAREEDLAECFECGALIPVSAPICPHCGAVFE
ncbi:MAG: CARDB domain-containing protein [Thermoplasmatota archaeon]